jgi:UDP-N-acetylglucosamine acyltransferase
MTAMANIHSTAVVDASARIGEDVEVGAYCFVGPGVDVGNGTILMEHVHVKANTTLGEGNVVHPFAAVGGDPQDRKFHGEHTVLRIGDRNQIREHVTIHRGTANGGGETVIGSDCLLMVGTHVAHDCVLGDRVTLANQVMLAGHVTVGDHATIGGGAGVHHYATIGRLSFVGGLTRIGRDVPPFMIAEGHPSEVRALNTIGLVRSGFSQDTIDALKACYKGLFRDSRPATDQLPELRAAHAGVPEVEELCAAVEAASAGTHGRSREATRQDDRWASTSS